MRVTYAIVFVSDMQRAISFYRDLLGLPLRFETPVWTEFATEGATLALHVSQVPGSSASDEHDLPPGRCRPGFGVPNLGEFHQKIVESGVVCLEEPKETFGVRIAQYVDPDGLAISVSEQRS